MRCSKTPCRSDPANSDDRNVKARLAPHGSRCRPCRDPVHHGARRGPSRVNRAWHLMLWEWGSTLERIHHALDAAAREHEAREASPSAAIIDSQIALFGRVVELSVSRSRAHSSVTLRFHRACQVVVSTAWAGFPAPRGSCGSPGRRQADGGLPAIRQMGLEQPARQCDRIFETGVRPAASLRNSRRRGGIFGRSCRAVRDASAIRSPPRPYNRDCVFRLGLLLRFLQ